jgi:hypothetical protein
MDIRDTRGPQLEQAPEVVVSHAPTAPGADQQDRPVLMPDTDPPRAARPSRGKIAGLAALVVLALALAGWLLLGGGDDSQVSTTPGAGAQQPAAIAPLSLTVDPVAGAVVGQPATLVVHYADGTGVFGGSTEEWGDQVGTSSLAEDTCPSPSPAASPLKGIYQATHTWAEPGSYPVKVAVSSYTCVDGAPVLEQATTTVTVEVAAK